MTPPKKKPGKQTPIKEARMIVIGDSIGVRLEILGHTFDGVIGAHGDAEALLAKLQKHERYGADE